MIIPAYTDGGMNTGQSPTASILEYQVAVSFVAGGFIIRVSQIVLIFGFLLEE